MARIVLFTYGGDLERDLRRAFAAAGHDFRPIEPDLPACEPNVKAADPAAFLLDLSTRPGRVRETAAYFASSKTYAGRPVLAVTEDEEQAARVAERIPGARGVPPKEALDVVAAALA